MQQKWGAGLHSALKYTANKNNTKKNQRFMKKKK